MKVKISELTDKALDYAVALAEGVECDEHSEPIWFDADGPEAPRVTYSPSTNWSHGGPIIERENITLIRADDVYEQDAKGFTTNKRIPQWFAECDRCVGHTPTTSYEGENMDPTFMISADGYYGPTPLIAAMRCYIASKLGEEIDIPEGLLLWTVVRFPSGMWSTGGKPTDPEYEHCEVFQVLATSRESAKKKAQALRSRQCKAAQAKEGQRHD